MTLRLVMSFYTNCKRTIHEKMMLNFINIKNFHFVENNVLKMKR